MQIHHLRNATALVTLGEHRLLLDPMLSDPGAMPGFKVFGGGRRRNPLVPLPGGADAALDRATGVIVTHEHPDHFDRPAVDWIRQRGLPVWAHPIDVASLSRKGLDARPLVDGALGCRVEAVRGQHGRGLLGWLMGPVHGVWLAHPGEPSLYITSDTRLTDGVREAIERLRPDVIVAPAGAADMGLGGEILFTRDELVELARVAPGEVVFNHLEALDHCPTTRAELRGWLAAAGLSAHVPEDGEVIGFGAAGPATEPRVVEPERPGFQKWLTAKFAGT